jgi:hypothetical protein
MTLSRFSMCRIGEHSMLMPPAPRMSRASRAAVAIAAARPVASSLPVPGDQSSDASSAAAYLDDYRRTAEALSSTAAELRLFTGRLAS